MRTVNNSVTLIPNRGKEGQEEKCPSGKGRTAKETKKMGQKREKEEIGR
jgi:hypothetical protein